MRIHQIDALRGFALLGILIVNIFVFHAPYSHYGAFYLQFEGLESILLEHMIFFCGGKFMFIYAFLFGYSFWMQYEKFEDKKQFQGYWNRRMWSLALFGVLHILLLSYGDILLPYALLGLTLPFFVRMTDRQVIRWFLLIYLIPIYEFVLRIMLEYPSIFIQPVVPLEDYIEIYGQGSWWEIFQLRLKDYFSFRNEKLITYIPKELALFLLGMLAGKKNLATTLKTRPALLFCGSAILVIATMYFFQAEIIGLFDHQNKVFHRVLLGLIIQGAEFMHGFLYIIGFLLLWKNGTFQKLLSFFKYPGKLSLTNYIAQSVICVFIFSGLGYYGQMTPSELILLALVIYLFQVLFSVRWLRQFQYGPLEYIWRRMSKRNK